MKDIKLKNGIVDLSTTDWMRDGLQSSFERLWSPHSSELMKFAENLNSRNDALFSAMTSSSTAISEVLEKLTNSASSALMAPSLEFARTLETFENPPWVSEFAKMAADYEKRFTLPASIDAARLFEAHQKQISEAAQLQTDSLANVFQAMESMKSPWLDIENTLNSLNGFAGLQGIGQALQTMPSFGTDLEKILRSDLGDWRDAITFPADIGKDVGLRTDFYRERGVDATLTDFPAAAFGETLDIVELRSPPPPVVVAYGSPVRPSPDAEEEVAFARTNNAHDWLQRLESRLRRYIDEKMTQAHGADWPQRRLPNGLCEQWEEKKRKGEENGESLPLISYADFTDYVLVICRRDNWPLFRPAFGRMEAVRESLQRLYPIRLCTAHSRFITQDDELLMYVEVKRLIKAFGN